MKTKLNLKSTTKCSMFLLIILLLQLIAPGKKTYASPKYYFNKYSITQSYVENRDYWGGPGWRDYIGMGKGQALSKTYKYVPDDPDGMTVHLTGDIRYSTWENKNTFYGYYGTLSTGKWNMTKLFEEMMMTNGESQPTMAYYKGWTIYVNGTGIEKIGDYLGQVIGTETEYPEYGKKNGYWYIRGAVVNTAPSILVTNPTTTQKIGPKGSITISGVVTDPDSQTLTVSATIGGRVATTQISGPAVNKVWTLSWPGSSLADGSYGSTPVRVNDGFVTTVANHTGLKTLDKTPPISPTLTSSKMTPTNQDIMVTASYSTDSTQKQYKIDNGAWTPYTGPITITENTTVYARGIDDVGNISAESNLVINNIDKTPPIITIHSYTTTPTNQDITVVATTNEGTLNKANHVFTENGSFEFVATDPAGNVTKRTVTITNIDKIPPTPPVVSTNPTTWTAGSVTVSISYSGDSVKKEYKIGTGAWTNYTTPFTVGGNINVQARGTDNASNVSDEVNFNITNIDKTDPNLFLLREGLITESSIEVILTGASDNQSGLHGTPLNLSKDNGSNWIGWTAGTPIPGELKHTFTDLQPNTEYVFKGQVRDLVGNVKEEQTTLLTLTKPITLTHDWVRNRNQVVTNFTINTNGNPSHTETMITRQNLITNEMMVVKDWSTVHTHRDRVGSYVGGYRYSAYSRNLKGEIGVLTDGATHTIKEVEKPDIEVKGFGSDKYVYDKTNKSIYIIGNSSGHIELEAKTEATEKLAYKFEKGTGATKVPVKTDELYGRVGEYKYTFNTPITNSPKEEYTLTLQSKYKEEQDGEMVDKTEDLESHVITVFKLQNITDLIDIEVEENGDNLDITFKDKTTYPDDIVREIANNSKIKDIIKDLTINGVDVDKEVTTTIPKGDLTIEKILPDNGGHIKETIRAGSIRITTNVSTFITELNEPWQLEIDVRTDKGNFKLPRDTSIFKLAGFSLDVYVAKGLTSPTGSHTDKFNQAKDYAGSAHFTEDNLNSLRLTESTAATIGIKVSRVLPTYHSEHLNLQDASDMSLRLQAIGNSNIEYDKTYIYNKMTNTMKAHGEQVHKDSEWVSELYYRSGNTGNRLFLITRDKIKAFKTTVDLVQDIPQNNNGSTMFNNELFIATSGGLKKVEGDGDTTPTPITQAINAITTDGFKLFVATDSGLLILNNSLGIEQELSNSDIFPGGGSVQTMYSSNGKIYVSKTKNGNEYVVLGK